MNDFVNTWGNFASVVGLLVSLVGFVVTIVAVFKAKSAARMAEAAAREAKEKVLKQGTLINISAVIGGMEEIVRLHRKKEWSIALDRISGLKRLLVELKDGHSGLSADQQTTIMGSVQQFSIISTVIEKHVSDGKPEPKTSHLNSIVSAQIEKMYAVATALKNG